jgi:hypothetical protein
MIEAAKIDAMTASRITLMMNRAMMMQSLRAADAATTVRGAAR